VSFEKSVLLILQKKIVAPRTRKASESLLADRDFVFTAVDKRASIWCIGCTKNAENHGKIHISYNFWREKV
jgi:hypothetical protein